MSVIMLFVFILLAYFFFGPPVFLLIGLIFGILAFVA